MLNFKLISNTTSKFRRNSDLIPRKCLISRYFKFLRKVAIKTSFTEKSWYDIFLEVSIDYLPPLKRNRFLEKGTFVDYHDFCREIYGILAGWCISVAGFIS